MAIPCLTKCYRCFKCGYEDSQKDCILTHCPNCEKNNQHDPISDFTDAVLRFKNAIERGEARLIIKE